MNTEEKIYNKIKNASNKGEKDFPNMDKVWNRVEEKLDNTIIVQKKNTWQKLAIAASVALIVSILYQFVSNNEIVKENNPNLNLNIVSNDSVEKIIEKTKEIIVENNKNSIIFLPKYKYNEKNYGFLNEPNTKEITSTDTINYTTQNKKEVEVISDEPIKLNQYQENNTDLLRSGFTNRNNAFNSANSNTDFLVRGKNFETNSANFFGNNEDKIEMSAKKKAKTLEKNKDLVVIDGVAMDKNYNSDKKLTKIDTSEIEEVTYLPNPLYIINGIEYSEESLFGNNATSPYAPLDKQKITSTYIVKPIDAAKIYGEKGKNGVILITTKKGKPAKK